MTHLSRRSFLQSASAAPALAAVGPGLKAAFAAPGTTNNILVVVFLRGGMDGLHFLAPATDSAYQNARPTIANQATGDGAAISVGSLTGTELFLHPNATGINNLYTSGDLAFIPASGLLSENRSHFESMDYMERGWADGEDPINEGWITRHIAALNTEMPLLSTVAVGHSNPISLLGYPAPAIADPDSFNVWGGSATLDLLNDLSAGSATGYAAAAQGTVNAIKEVQAKLTPFSLSGDREDDEIPEEEAVTETAVNYPGGSFSSSMQNLAAMIKGNLGVQIATVDIGGWDHHNNLIGEFNGRLNELDGTLAAFWDDVTDYRDRITVITMTEFGRRVEENGSRGTDHGNASVMMALGGRVQGGQIYGEWPGLNSTDLTSGGDMHITTDYRTVVAEALTKCTENTAVETVFPTISDQYLGVFEGQGAATTPVVTSETNQENNNNSYAFSDSDFAALFGGSE